MAMWQRFADLMQAGGPVMWLLLALSVISVTLVVERTWYWLRTNHRARLARVRQIHGLLARGDRGGAKLLAETDPSVYGRVTLRLLEGRVTEARALEIVEAERAGLERYLPTLSTTITAAPLLGLLGTVIGLITTFRLMGPELVDPKLAGKGLAEALINTAAGLIIALIVLFPYNVFRAQVDHTLGRLEALVAAAGAGEGEKREVAGTGAAPDAEAAPDSRPGARG